MFLSQEQTVGRGLTAGTAASPSFRSRGGVGITGRCRLHAVGQAGQLVAHQFWLLEVALARQVPGCIGDDKGPASEKKRAKRSACSVKVLFAGRAGNQPGNGTILA